MAIVQKITEIKILPILILLPKSFVQGIYYTFVLKHNDNGRKQLIIILARYVKIIRIRLKTHTHGNVIFMSIPITHN